MDTPVHFVCIKILCNNSVFTVQIVHTKIIEVFSLEGLVLVMRKIFGSGMNIFISTGYLIFQTGKFV